MDDGAQQQFYRILSTNRILRFLDIFCKALKILLFNELHPSRVKVLDEFVNRHLFVMRLIVEVIAPMTKITRNYKYCILILEVFRQFLTQSKGSLWTQMAHYYRNYFEFITKDMLQIRHVHLQTMLLFLIFFSEILPLYFTLQCIYCYINIFVLQTSTFIFPIGVSNYQHTEKLTVSRNLQ